MFSRFAAAALLLSVASAIPQGVPPSTSPSDPKRFKFYNTPSKGVICDGDTGPDGLTLWYQDLVGPTIGVFNYKTEKFEEFQIPYAEQTDGSIPGIPGTNTTALQCVVRTGKDNMVYGGAGIRNEIVMVNPYAQPKPTLQIFSQKYNDPAGNLQPFNDAWAANNGLYFSQTTGDVVTLFDYATHKFTNYPCPTAQSGPLGMRTDKFNNLWFTNFQLQYISKLDTLTGVITEFKDCCPLPESAFPEVLRSSTQNQKYLWANAFGDGGYIRITPGDSPDDIPAFAHYTNPSLSPPGALTFPFENDNDFCGRIWYTSPSFDILVYYTPSSNAWTTVDVPSFPGYPSGGAPVGGNFEVIMHRGPGHYMWFSIGTLGKLVRYELETTCVGEPQ